MDFKTERIIIRPVEIGDRESIFTYRADPETRSSTHFPRKNKLSIK